MIGYDNIAAADRPAHATRGQACKSDRLRTHVARTLVTLGWLETKNDPLESDQKSKWLGKPDGAITLSNPATVEMSVLRRSLLSGLAASAQRNVFRGATSIRLFEIDRTFATTPGTWTLGGITGGAVAKSAWRNDTRIDLFTVKGELEELFESLGIVGLNVAAITIAPYKPGETAQLKIGDVVVGTFGEIDARAIKIDRLAYKLFAFEIDLEQVVSHYERAVTFTSMNKLPASTRDLAIVAKSAVSFASLRATIESVGATLLERVELVDEYKGAPVAADSRSLALRLTFRAADRTLTSDEVTGVVETVVAALAREHGAALRA